MPVTDAFATEKDNFKQSYQLEATGDYEQAAATIEGLLSNEGDVAEFAHLRYAWLNYLQGNHNKAIKYYKKALALNPKSIDASVGISLVMLAQLRWKEAAVYANQVIEQAPANYAAHLNLLASESGQRKWRQLEIHAQKMLKLYPTQATLWLYLARARAWSGKKEQAAQAYKSVLLRFPDNLEAANYLGGK